MLSIGLGVEQVVARIGSAVDRQQLLEARLLFPRDGLTEVLEARVRLQVHEEGLDAGTRTTFQAAQNEHTRAIEVAGMARR